MTASTCHQPNISVLRAVKFILVLCRARHYHTPYIFTIDMSWLRQTLLKTAARLRTSGSSSGKVLTREQLSPNILACHYAVRGELVLRAEKLANTLKAHPEQLPFKKITYCNIGNPQELGQKPITFIRQVCSVVDNPELLKHKDIFPADVLQRAEKILKHIPSTGAYTTSRGIPFIREEIADFIRRRDGKQGDRDYTSAEHIFMSDGASPAVQQSLRMLIRDASSGVMIPIPQYPLYSATIPLLGGKQIPYYLDEENNWTMRVNELEQAVARAREQGVQPRGLVVINPGNPTGQCLEQRDMEAILDFAARHKLVLLADEVYQDNVYTAKPFVSFKKVLHGLGAPLRDAVELLSFHSVSKGMLGECGKRGGYVEMTNIDPAVVEQYYKLSSIGLCPNVTGQLVVSLMVNPPQVGEPSHAQYHRERSAIYDSLKRRAELVVQQLNQLEGIQCNTAEGAMYAFPRITLPRRAIELAKAEGQAPDAWYCLQLLARTGMVVVPGSGFGQRPDTFHFRTTFLPSEESIQQVLNDFKAFHTDFMNKYRD